MQKTTFTLAEAAELLVCHKETLRRAILDGSLRAARLGRGYRISRADLQQFWSERGGGALFDRPEQEAAPPVEAEPVNEGNDQPAEQSRDKGPHQLTLPID